MFIKNIYIFIEQLGYFNRYKIMKQIKSRKHCYSQIKIRIIILKLRLLFFLLQNESGTFEIHLLIFFLLVDSFLLRTKLSNLLS